MNHDYNLENHFNGADMQAYHDLLKAGYDIENNGKAYNSNFLRDLMRGHVEHIGRNTDNLNLKQAGINGQKPEYFLAGDAETHAANLLRMPPHSVFAVSGSILPIAEPNGEVRMPRTMQAAAHYAGHLGARKFLAFTSDSSEILPYMLGDKPMTGPVMEAWSDVWKPIVKKIKASKKFKNARSKRAKYRLAAIELCKQTAHVLEIGFRKHHESIEDFETIKVIPAFFDSKRSVIKLYDRPNDEAPFKFKGQIPVSVNFKQHKTKNKYFGCSCCDSRALHTHMYCAEPGQYTEVNVIATVFPNYKTVIESKQPNFPYLQLEIAKARGCPGYVHTQHTKCGGIAGLVQWIITETPPADPYLAAYLEQGKDDCEKTITLAKSKGLMENIDDVYRLAEIHMARLSASNIKEFVGKDEQVLSNYLDIDTRQIYALPLCKPGSSDEQNLEQSYELFKKFKEGTVLTLTQLYEIPARLDRSKVRASLDRAFVS